MVQLVSSLLYWSKHGNGGLMWEEWCFVGMPLPYMLLAIMARFGENCLRWTFYLAVAFWGGLSGCMMVACDFGFAQIGIAFRDGRLMEATLVPCFILIGFFKVESRQFAFKPGYKGFIRGLKCCACLIGFFLSSVWFREVISSLQLLARLPAEMATDSNPGHDGVINMADAIREDCAWLLIATIVAAVSALVLVRVLKECYAYQVELRANKNAF